MEDEIIKIKTFNLTIIENEDKTKKDYSFDISGESSFKELKKLISYACHLIKNTFKIFYKDQEYTIDNDDDIINDLFPDNDTIYLNIVNNNNNNNVYEIEKKLFNINFAKKKLCESHILKYTTYYCFDCQKSICSDCYKELHNEHKVIEKLDVVAPAREIINKICKDDFMYKINQKLSHYESTINFRIYIKESFEKLHQLLNNLEKEINEIVQHFINRLLINEENANSNIELLKKYCINNFIKFKNINNFL